MRRKSKAPPDMSEWNLDSIDKLEDMMRPIILAAAAEALDLALEDESTHISFPIAWGPKSDGGERKTPKDPLTLYLWVAVAGDLDTVPYAFDLRGEMQDLIDTCEMDGSFSWGLTRLRDALRDMVQKMDAALAAAALHNAARATKVST